MPSDMLTQIVTTEKKKKKTWNFLLQNQQGPFIRSKRRTFKMV